MKDITTFGETLRELSRQHGWTPQMLAQHMHLQSGDVSRLMRDGTSDAKRMAFFELIQTHDDLFSQDELQALENALDVNRVGKRPYKAHSSFFRLMFDAEEDEREIWLRDLDITLTEYLSRFSERVPLRFLCINCCETALPHAVAPLFEDQQRLVELYHYTAINAATRNPALFLRFASHFNGDRRYSPFALTERDNGADALFFAPNVLLIQYGAAPAMDETAIVIRSDQTAGTLPRLQRTGLFDKVYRNVSRMSRKPQPFLGTLNEGTPTQVIAFLHTIYQSIPRTKAIWQIKDAPGFDLLPPKLLMQLLEDSPDYLKRYEGITADSSIQRYFQHRYEVFTAVGRQTHLTFSVDGFRRLVELGYMTHHPQSIRPLTPVERAAFLDELLFSLRKKPGFHLHLLREGLRVRRFRMTGIEGYGLLFSGVTPTSTALPSFSPEPLLLSQYLEFYQHELLPRHVLRDDETINLLLSLRNSLPWGGVTP